MARGYIIAHVTVTDPEIYAGYVARNADIFARHGGRFLVRGGASLAPEGPMKERHVIVEFPDFASARAAYRSPEYQENLKLRLAGAKSDVVLVEGVE